MQVLYVQEPLNVLSLEWKNLQRVQLRVCTALLTGPPSPLTHGPNVQMSIKLAYSDDILAIIGRKSIRRRASYTVEADGKSE